MPFGPRGGVKAPMHRSPESLWIGFLNLQEATAKNAGPYLVPGSGFIGVTAGMVK